MKMNPQSSPFPLYLQVQHLDAVVYMTHITKCICTVYHSTHHTCTHPGLTHLCSFHIWHSCCGDKCGMNVEMYNPSTSTQLTLQELHLLRWHPPETETADSTYDSTDNYWQLFKILLLGTDIHWMSHSAAQNDFEIIVQWSRWESISQGEWVIFTWTRMLCCASIDKPDALNT